MNPLIKIQGMRGLYAALLCRPDGSVFARASVDPKFERALEQHAHHFRDLARARTPKPKAREWHSVVLRFSRGTVVLRQSRHGTLLLWGTSTLDVTSEAAHHALRITLRGLEATEPAPPAMSGEMARPDAVPPSKQTAR
ncbi:MAG: hypothetical protein U0235_04065 [Polyangiaceae bacterium]